jgi:thioredoxin 1
MVKMIMLFLLLGTASCVSNSSNSGYAQVSANDFLKMYSENKSKAQLIDVRTPGEFKGGHIEGAINIDFNSSNFKQNIEKLDKETPVFVYCLSGGRSSAAVSVFESLGFKNVTELEGGMMAWRSAGLPEVTASFSNNRPSNNLTESIKNNKLVLVDFYADWCAPCKKMKPVLEELETENVVKVSPVNADQDLKEVQVFKVENLPTLILIKEGVEVWRGIGYHSKEQLLEIIQKFK